MASPAAAEQAEGLAGDGRYRIERRVGRGGMGEVHAAHDRVRGHPVALKRLRLEEHERHRARAIEQFHHEYRTLSELAHPNVVQVFDYGVDALGSYYTMELLEGASLRKLAPLPYREACAMLRDVCAVLSVLHSRRLLHRDVTPNNIQRSTEGVVKLIDFGSMAQMGVGRVLIGTPPMIPPEAVYQQPLDGRADLYAVGACLYYALTGRHAYGARQIAQLPEAWSKRPAAPSRYSECPPALDALVMELLSQDPLARPRSATEVIERLNAIAGLSALELVTDRSAYLTTPRLVGRQQVLDQLGVSVQRLELGEGGVLLIEGEPGAGRSRMLATFALEAQLAGATVARACASEVELEPYAALGALLRKLPNVRDPLLLQVMSGEIHADIDRMRRTAIQRALRRYIRSSRTKVVLVVDDFVRCDEPSQAALATAVRAFRGRSWLMVVSAEGASCESDSPALEVVRRAVVPLSLSPLADFEVKELLESVFGDVPNLHVLADFIGARALGSPRAVMELAQHLVDTGVVRYADGSFVVPDHLEAGHLPASISAARGQKLALLDDAARALASVLAFAEGTGLGLDALVELSGDSHERAHAALAVLRTAGFVSADTAQLVLVPRTLAETLRAELPASEQQRACSLVADALAARKRDRLEVARYLWRAGRKSELIDTLLAELAERSRWDNAFRDYSLVLRDAVSACVELGRPPRDGLTLQFELCRAAMDGSIDPSPYFLQLFTRLAIDSGLRDYEALPAELDPMTRLQQAFEAANARFEQTPDAQRGLAPIDAIRQLARSVAVSCGGGAVVGNKPLHDAQPSLAPFVALSPAIQSIHGYLVPAGRALVAGRYEEAEELYRSYLEKCPSPAESGLDPEEHATVRSALHLAIGAIAAAGGRPEALERAAELERSPAFKAPAWGLRQAHAYTLGNLQEARRAGRRIERALLQSPVRPPYAVSTVQIRAIIHALADDATGLREVRAQAEAVAAIAPTFAPHVSHVRAEQCRLLGAHAEALEISSRALSEISAGERAIWPGLVGAKIAALTALGRVHEAIAEGMEQLERARAVKLDRICDLIELPLAIAEARAENFASACERLDRMIARAEELATEGVRIGYMHELRAYVASWMQDEQGFAAHAHACAQQYKKSGGDPALVAKYERLVKSVQRAADSVPPPAVHPLAASQSELASDSSQSDTSSTQITVLLGNTGETLGEKTRHR